MTDNEAAEVLKTLIFEDQKLNDAVCVVLSALRAQQDNKKFNPPCYQPEQFGGGCAYQCYDGDDEPIDGCKECPLCNSDKHRKQQEAKSPCTACGFGGKHLDAPPCTSCPAYPKEAEKNEPLTFNELTHMDGCPVWVEIPLDRDRAFKFWVLVAVGTDDVYLSNSLGKAFSYEEVRAENGVIYRCPPEGGADKHI